MRVVAEGALPLVLAAVLLTGCTGREAEPVHTQRPDPQVQPTPSGSPAAQGATRPRVERVLAKELEAPWGLDFLPDGDALVGERDSGRLLRLTPGGRVRTVGTIEVSAADGGEGGLLGLAVSPDFARDSSVYAYTTAEDDNRVLRLVLDGDRIARTQVVLDGIPNGVIHDGGRMAFGPDSFLYVTTGEVGDPELAQDPESLGGKILRITTDGRPAPGNPFPGSPVWSLGHRNVQGLAWDDRGRLWASEFGDQDFDELNLIEPGANYGWPEVEGTGGGKQFTDPQLVWPTDEASPSGLAFAEGHLWMAALRGNRLWRITVTPGGRARAATPFLREHGRLRTVALAPDGSLWVTTSNRDGRGDPRPGDDRILQVSPRGR